MSDSSDGMGWLGENDERNRVRERNKKPVWKILEEDSPSKNDRGKKDN